MFGTLKLQVRFGTWKNEDNHGKSQNTRLREEGSNWCPPEYEFIKITSQNLSSILRSYKGQMTHYTSSNQNRETRDKSAY